MQLEQRFLDKFIVDPVSGCWLWTAGKDHDGYGNYHHRRGTTGGKGRMVSAHVHAYVTVIGPVPQGLELDHTCRVRHCCNPHHVEPVTHRVNCQRGDAGKRPARLTCRKGHVYSILPSGAKRCKPCWNEYMREFRKGERRLAKR